MRTVTKISPELNLTSQSQWKKIYVIAGIAALLSFCLTFGDLIFGSVSGADLTALPQTAVERFAEFRQSWLLGL